MQRHKSHFLSGHLVPRSLTIALALESLALLMVLRVFAVYGRAHAGIVFGLPIVAQYENAISYFLTAVGLTLTLWRFFPELHPKPIQDAGSFPHYIDFAKQLICKSKPGSRFDAQVDSPEHTSVANFEKFFAFHESLKAALRVKVVVRLLLVGHNAPISRANPNFDYRNNFAGFKKTTQFRNFFRKYWPGMPEPQGSSEFDQLMAAFMKRILRELIDCGAEVRRLTDEQAEHVSKFMWKTDAEVLFVRLDSSVKGPARGQYSAESSIVRERKQEFAKNWEAASPIDKTTLD